MPPSAATTADIPYKGRFCRQEEELITIVPGASFASPKEVKQVSERQENVVM